METEVKLTKLASCAGCGTKVGAVIAGGHTIQGAEPIYGLAVTGFALLGHSYEMAQGSGYSLHIDSAKIPYHPEALELADMGFLPAGAYRNRTYAGAGVKKGPGVTRAMEDICYDPQTSGGLLMALPAQAAEDCLAELQTVIPQAAIIGQVTQRQELAVYLD